MLFKILNSFSLCCIECKNYSCSNSKFFYVMIAFDKNVKSFMWNKEIQIYYQFITCSLFYTLLGIFFILHLLCLVHNLKQENLFDTASVCLVNFTVFMQLLMNILLPHVKYYMNELSIMIRRMELKCKFVEFCAIVKFRVFYTFILNLLFKSSDSMQCVSWKYEVCIPMI